MCPILNSTVEEMIGQNIHDLSEASFKNKSRAMIQVVMREHGPLTYEIEKNGRDYMVHMYPIFDVRGNVERIAFYTRNITLEKQAEAILRQTEQTQHALLEAINELVLLIKADGTGIMANNKTLQSFKITQAQFKDKNLFDLLPKNLAASHRKQIGRVIETRQPVKFEDVRDGCHILYSINPIFDEKGEVNRLAIFGFDISERVKAEKDLKASEIRFRTLIEGGQMAIVIGRKGVILYANQRFLKMFGYETADEVIGMSIARLFLEEAKEEVEETVKLITGDKIKNLELEEIGVKRNGELLNVYMNVSRVFLQDGPAEIAFYTDITERKKNEQELTRHREHLEELVSERTAALQASEEQVRRINTLSETALELAKAGYWYISLEDPTILFHPSE